MALLSVDIGTGGTRSVLFSETGGIIASTYREYSFTSPGRDGRNWMRKQSGMLSGRLSGRRQSSTARKLKPFAYPACPIILYRYGGMGRQSVTESFRKTTGRQKRPSRFETLSEKRNISGSEADGCVRPADYVKLSG